MPWVRWVSGVSINRQGVAPWAFALLFFATSLVVRFLLDSSLDGLAFTTFYPAILTATLICGWLEGILVLVLSTFAGWYFFLEPRNTFVLKEVPTVGIFIITGCFTIFIVAALREALKRAATAMAAKETLFSELQHRVANNLQLAVSLIRVAQRNLQDPVTAAKKLNRAEERLIAMSELHRRLYGGTAFVNGLEPLLTEVLAIALRDFPVAIHVYVEDVPGLSIDQMTAIAFLVNEAALNAAKHVYSKGLGTRFDVSLTKDRRGRLLLSISDDGPGIGARATDTGASSLGMGIMEAFANQLGGRLEIGQGVGASLSVEFIEHHLRAIHNTPRARHQDRSSGRNT